MSRVAFQALGVPYSWGGGHLAGKPRWPHGGAGLRGGVGYDCSGFARGVLLQLGVLKSGDYTAAMLQVKSKPLVRAQIMAGDLVFYGTPASHVEVYLGDGKLIGALGGSADNGDNRSSRVRVMDLGYRRNASYGRIMVEDRGHFFKVIIPLILGGVQ